MLVFVFEELINLLAFLLRHFLTYSTFYYTEWIACILQLQNHTNFNCTAHVYILWFHN